MNDLLSSDETDLSFYSPYNCIPGVDRDILVEQVVRPWLSAFLEDPDHSVRVDGGLVLHSHLEWDSKYFGFPIDKLHATFGVQRRAALSQLVRDMELKHEKFYLYADVASEHTATLQAMTGLGFRLIEPRITFLRDRLSSFDEPRHAVRRARLEDIPLLRDVAAQCANEFDRVHADSCFSDEIANGYLASYVENSVRGFADVVLVPDAENVPTKAFLTGAYSLEGCTKLGLEVSRLVLGAVHAECSGWFRKLSSEMTYDMRDNGADCILMTTQTANRAAIRAMENLGYRIGAATHILAYARP